MNESRCNLGSACWPDKASIVEKGFPDLENATESLAYKQTFCKISAIKKCLFKLSIRDTACFWSTFFVKHTQEYLLCILTVVSSYCQAAWKGESSNN